MKSKYSTTLLWCASRAACSSWYFFIASSCFLLASLSFGCSSYLGSYICYLAATGARGSSTFLARENGHLSSNSSSAKLSSTSSLTYGSTSKSLRISPRS
jgi:hypothetical protein